MFFRILQRDLKRKKTMNFILLLFIILAALFLASSVNNLITINGALDYFMEKSKVPDYFCVAVGEEEEDPIGDYLKEDKDVTDYEIRDSFTITRNEQITIVKRQNDSNKEPYHKTNTLNLESLPENFMKVFAEDGSELALQDDELALSRIEADENDLQIGDKLKIKIGEVEQEFTVAAIMKDVVFGSKMLGMKRHVISEGAFRKFAAQEKLFHTRIYCINYEDEDTFIRHWKAQNFKMITNVSKPLVRQCYVMDMLMAATLTIVSICLILISFMVLRFTIVFTLQEDYKEIGIMKAIGMRDRGIKGIYLVKYLMISVVGAGVGFACSMPFGNLLLSKIALNIPLNQMGGPVSINLICAVAVVGIVSLFCWFSANKLKKFSAIEAIRNGSSGESYRAQSHLKLSKKKKMKPAFYMALNDILSDFKRYSVLAITFCMGTMLILLPLNALHTLKSDSVLNLFSICPTDSYMETDRMEIYVVDKTMKTVTEDLQEIKDKVNAKGYHATTGTEMGYIIPCYSNDPEDLYDYFTLQPIGSWDSHYIMLEGKEPELTNEIAITERTAEKMEVSIGDTIHFKMTDRTEDFIITGIYQSMLNMGNGFRVSTAARLDPEYIAGIFALQVEIEELNSKEACALLTDMFPEHNVFNAMGFLDTMVGDITGQLDALQKFMVLIVLTINGLITALTMKTIMTKEKGDIALLKSMGFRNHIVRKWQWVRICLVLAVSIGSGIVISRLISPYVVGPVFVMMGATQIKLTTNPLEAYIIYPLLLMAVTGAIAMLCTKAVKKVDLKEVNNVE